MNKKTFKFGKRSNKQLDTCHTDLQKIFNLAISISDVDFGISEGHRPISKQQDYYAIGRTVDLHKKPITNIDGVNKLGKHNYSPSNAVDVYIWHDNKGIRQRIAYDKYHLVYISGIINTCAETLFKRGEITHLIRWGGNWDSDGYLIYDQSFDDLPHFELIKV